MSHLVPIPTGLALSDHPSDITYDSSDNTMILINGVLHVTDADGQSSHFWIPDITIYPRIQSVLTDTGFSDLRFTPFSSPDRWNLQYPSMAVHPDPLTNETFTSAEAAFRAHHNSRSATDQSRRGQDPEEFIQSPPTLQRNQTVRFDTNRPDPTPVTPAQAVHGTAPVDQQDTAARERALRAELARLQQQQHQTAQLLRAAQAQAQMQAQPPTGNQPPPPAQPRPPTPTTQPQQAPPQPQPFHYPFNPQPPFQPQGQPQNQAPPNLNLPTGLTLDPNVIALMTWMQQQQQSFIQSMQSTKPTRPQIPFPKWDGKDTTMANFIERLDTYKRDPYFAGADWTRKLPGYDAHSTLLRSEILEKLPAKELFMFHN